MRSLTKLTFSAITLSLVFTPTLHGNVREKVNTLKRQIAAADNTQVFKSSFNTFLGSKVTTNERKNALAMLDRYAQKNKEHRQNELDNMGKLANIDGRKRELAKGIALASVGGILAVGAIGALGAPGIDNPISSFINNTTLLEYTPYLCIPLGFGVLAAIASIETRHCHQPYCNHQRTRWILSEENLGFFNFIGGAALSCFCLKCAFQCFKNGLNYKKSLKQQIASLDEIIACIQQAKRNLR